MASINSIVLNVRSLEEFVRFILNNHVAPTTLVVCSSKDAFTAALREEESSNCRRGDDGEADEAQALMKKNLLWATPTLRVLSTSRSVKVAFCSDITHLRAYLSVYRSRQLDAAENASNAGTRDRGLPILAVLNLVQLHRDTSACSAQGINRTMSLAIEAAHGIGSKLVLVEHCYEATRLPAEIEYEAELPSSDDHERNAFIPDPWEEEISILNVSTKSFGAGERGWVGRTVKVRNIAERWCAFMKLSNYGQLERLPERPSSGSNC